MKQVNGVERYYSRFGSWMGYNLVMRRSQHAGYWMKDTKNERQAQENYLGKMAEYLQLKPSEKILDAGSGQGYAARFLAKTNDVHITGITITPREVRVSERLSKQYKNLNFVLGDYSATTFKDATFDVIYTTETLCHAKDMAKTMSEFYRILKPGGRVALFDYESSTNKLDKSEQALVNFLEKYAATYGARQQSPGQISNLMRKAGFVNVTEKDWSKYTKPTFDRLRRIAKPLSWITPSSRLAPYFVNAVAANYAYSPRYENGTFRYIVYQGKKK